jgi:predicted RNA binding protein YcfA (HicA-like mRNA interferase family)
MTGLPRSWAKLLRALVAEGWRLHRHCGSGHLQLRHTSGAVATVASTPGGCRSRRNEAALLRRLVRQSAEARP